MPDYHKSALGEKVVNFMNPRNKSWIVDGTLGDGGHTELILQHSGSQCQVLGIDQDLEALARAEERLSIFGDRVTFVHGNFSDIREILMKNNIQTIDGFLLDLGVSSFQLDTPQRGFSFSKDGPLDMRMNPNGFTAAADLLEHLSDVELVRILKEFGEERFSKRIVRAIRKAQANGPILSTLQFSQIIAAAVPRTRLVKIHHATRTFQALRIAVNNELEVLKQALESFLDVLNTAGRALIISFHSLEDRIVKYFFQAREKGCVCPPGLPICTCGKVPEVRILTRKPIRPSHQEQSENPRSSSARLRVAEKLHV